MKKKKEKAEAIDSLKQVKKDFGLLNAGEWKPDESSIEASVNHVQTALDYLKTKKKKKGKRKVNPKYAAIMKKKYENEIKNALTLEELYKLIQVRSKTIAVGKYDSIVKEFEFNLKKERFTILAENVAGYMAAEFAGEDYEIKIHDYTLIVTIDKGTTSEIDGIFDVGHIADLCHIKTVDFDTHTVYVLTI